MLLAQSAGIIGHSGYYVPLYISRYIPALKSEYHDAHHYLYNKNFGLMYTFVEKIFGTLHIPEKEFDKFDI